MSVAYYYFFLFVVNFVTSHMNMNLNSLEILLFKKIINFLINFFIYLY